jgi:hypothetical protein
MSALGQKRTFRGVIAMFASPPKADMCGANTGVCFGPIADSCSAAKINDSITSSARARSDGEMVFKPNVFDHLPFQ